MYILILVFEKMTWGGGLHTNNKFERKLDLSKDGIYSRQSMILA